MAIISGMKRKREEPVEEPKEINYTHKVLPCGLTVLHHEEHDLPKYNGDVFLVVPVGTLHVTSPSETELAHWTEHILLRSVVLCQRDKWFTNYSDLVKHPETFHDHTLFGFPVNGRNQLEQAVSILSEIATKAVIEQKDVDDDVNLLKAELTKFLEDPGFRLITAIKDSVFMKPGNSTDSKIFMESLPRRAKDVISFYKKWYSLKTMCLIFVGNCTSEELMEVVQINFDGHDEQSKEKPILCSQSRIDTIEDEDIRSAGFLMYHGPRLKLRKFEDLVPKWNALIKMEAFNHLMSKWENEYRVHGECVDDYGPYLLYKFTNDFKYSSDEESIEIVKRLFAPVLQARQQALPQFCLNYAASEFLDDIQSETKRYHGDISFRCSYIKDMLINRYMYDDVVYDPDAKLEFAREWLKNSGPSTSPAFDFLVGCEWSFLGANMSFKAEDIVKIYDLMKLQPPEHPLRSIEDTQMYDISGLSEVVEWKFHNGMSVLYCRAPYVRGCTLSGYALGGLSTSNDLAPNLTTDHANLVVKALGKDKFSFLGDDINIGEFSRSFVAYFDSSNIADVLEVVPLIFEGLDIPHGRAYEEMTLIREARKSSIRNGFDQCLQMAEGRFSDDKDLKSKLYVKSACEYFNACFKDPSEFKLLIIGDLKVDEVETVVEEKLGLIPKAKSPLSFPSLQQSVQKKEFGCGASAEGKRRFRLVHKGSSKRIEYYISIPLRFKETEQRVKDIMLSESLEEMMCNEVFSTVHGAAGKVHTISSELHCSHFQESGFMIFSFSSIELEANVAGELVDLVLTALERFRLHGPKHVVTLKITCHGVYLRKDELTDKVKNAFWSPDNDFKKVYEMREKILKEIDNMSTPEDWKKTIRRICPFNFKKKHVAVLLFPRSGSDPSDPPSSSDSSDSSDS